MSRFITLSSSESPDVLDEKLLRAVMVANARFACDEATGRNHGDPVFEEVVERRQKWPGYSSCGDLIHWCLRRAGYRDERVLNREDDDGALPWRMGVNVSRLVYGTGHAFEWWRPGAPLGLRAGDMALIGEHGQEHVFIVASVDDGVVGSYDYGQWFNGAHGGRRVTRLVRVGGDGRFYFYTTTLPGRPFIGRLDPFELLEGPYLRREIEPAQVPDSFDGGMPLEPPSLPDQRPLVTTREIQTALSELGFNPGPLDGIFGPRTRAAVKAFQRSARLVADGIVGPKTRAAMRERLAADA
jgi:hypothetical protein